MVDKVLFRQPGEALLVDVQVREGRGRGTLRQQSADRFAFLKTEGRDVDQASDVRWVRAQSRDDLAAVGVASDNGRAVLMPSSGRPSFPAGLFPILTAGANSRCGAMSDVASELSTGCAGWMARPSCGRPARSGHMQVGQG